MGPGSHALETYDQPITLDLEYPIVSCISQYMASPYIDADYKIRFTIGLAIVNVSLAVGILQLPSGVTLKDLRFGKFM
jgi:hypothetical protein